MSIHPSKLLPFYLIGVLLFLAVTGFCAEAKLSEFQKQARTYRIQGYALQQEDLEAAIPYYQKALALDPAYEVAYNDLGIVFESLGDKERAIQMYLKAIKISPNYPNSYSNLALLYEGEKDYTKAIYYWGIRASLGYSFEPWAQEARKRVEEISRVHPEAGRYIPEQYKQKVLEQEKLQKMAAEEAELQNKINGLKREIGEVDLEIEKESSLSGPKKAVKLEAKPDLPKPSLSAPGESLEEAELRNKIKKLRREIDEVDFEIEKESDAGHKISSAKPPVLETKKIVKAKAKITEPSYPNLKVPEKPGLVTEPLSVDKQRQDNKSRALDYLAGAKENFSKGQYVAALKEATVAGYLDPSNGEISAFVEKVRKTLLQ